MVVKIRYDGLNISINHALTFDTVDHKLLCIKIDFYGSRGVAHNLICQLDHGLSVLMDSIPTY